MWSFFGAGARRSLYMLSPQCAQAQPLKHMHLLPPSVHQPMHLHSSACHFLAATRILFDSVTESARHAYFPGTCTFMHNVPQMACCTLAMQGRMCMPYGMLLFMSRKDLRLEVLRQ